MKSINMFLAAVLLSANTATAAGLKGSIQIDGSSTVYPITEAVAEEFLKVEPNVRVKVGISGTGGGFKKFFMGETDISDASRPVKDNEAAVGRDNGIEFIELPIAFDGISVVVNPDNKFVDYLTVAELKKIWEPNSTVTKWSDVRKDWPSEKINLYGPGTDSGTFDYFTEKVNGKEKASRPDFTASEDDNTLVTGVSGDPNGMGYFGYAYYAENQSKLKVVPIKDGDGSAITPSFKTINDGSYKPLSRPIFIYVNRKSADKPEIATFVKFYLKNAKTLSKEVGYVPFSDAAYRLVSAKFDRKTAGSVFSKPENAGKTIEEILQ